jgi:hypothetical protein
MALASLNRVTPLHIRWSSPHTLPAAGIPRLAANDSRRDQVEAVERRRGERTTAMDALSKSMWQASLMRPMELLANPHRNSITMNAPLMHRNRNKRRCLGPDIT